MGTTMKDTATIRIFNTTLRNGEQSPGAAMTLPIAPQVALAISYLGIVFACLWKGQLRWIGVPMAAAVAVWPRPSPPMAWIAADGNDKRRTHIAARHREGLRLIPIEEVQFFLAEQKYTTVRHLQGEDLIEDSLRALEEEFDSMFVRIHRNALVSVRYLERIERNAEGQYFVRLRGCEAPLQVSRRMAGELRDRFRI